jgi:hypothetical protein
MDMFYNVELRYVGLYFVPHPAIAVTPHQRSFCPEGPIRTTLATVGQMIGVAQSSPDSALVGRAAALH